MQERGSSTFAAARPMACHAPWLGSRPGAQAPPALPEAYRPPPRRLCRRLALPRRRCSASIRASLFMFFNTALGSYIVGTITLLVVSPSRRRVLGWQRRCAGAGWRRANQTVLLPRPPTPPAPPLCPPYPVFPAGQGRRAHGQLPGAQRQPEPVHADQPHPRGAQGVDAGAPAPAL